MTTKDFRGIFTPSQAKHPIPNNAGFVSNLVKDMFSLQQLFLIGALGQTVILAILPARYALIPAVLLLLHTVISTTLQSLSPARNTFDHGVIHGKTTAQLPQPSYNPASGASPFGATPARAGVVVLHLGVRFNHALGPLAPGAKESGEQFAACMAELAKRAEEFGCLGATTWRAAERERNNTLLGVYYFRDMAGLNAFAHDPVHRAAWDWYRDFCQKKGYGHIGVFHEVFYSGPGQYETIYANMPPVLMAATNVPTVNEATGEAEWVLPLVDANVPALRSLLRRMGKVVEKAEEQTAVSQYGSY